jgi:hypothetical protein
VAIAEEEGWQSGYENVLTAVMLVHLQTSNCFILFKYYQPEPSSCLGLFMYEG